MQNKMKKKIEKKVFAPNAAKSYLCISHDQNLRIFALTTYEHGVDFALGQNQPHFHELSVLKFHSNTTHSIMCLLSINSYFSVTDSHILNPLSTIEVLTNSV